MKLCPGFLEMKWFLCLRFQFYESQDVNFVIVESLNEKKEKKSLKLSWHAAGGQRKWSLFSNCRNHSQDDADCTMSRCMIHISHHKVHTKSTPRLPVLFASQYSYFQFFKFSCPQEMSNVLKRFLKFYMVDSFMLIALHWGQVDHYYLQELLFFCWYSATIIILWGSWMNFMVFPDWSCFIIIFSTQSKRSELGAFYLFQRI